MSLVKSPALTPEKNAANQANARHSAGPATEPGKKRSQASNLKHGVYSSNPRQILEALGEDPADYDAFEAAVLGRFAPGDEFERALVKKIVRNFWRADRSRQVQESTMVAEIERLEAGRAAQAEERERESAEMLEGLHELLEMARRGDFSDREVAGNAYRKVYGEGRMNSTGQEIATLLKRWQDYEASRSADAMARLGALVEAQIEGVLAEDESFRQREIEISPAQRQAAMGPVQPYAPAMIRQEESLARQVDRDVRLLYFVRNQEAKQRPPAPHETGPRAGLAQSETLGAREAKRGRQQAQDEQKALVGATHTVAAASGQRPDGAQRAPLQQLAGLSGVCAAAVLCLLAWMAQGATQALTGVMRGAKCCRKAILLIDPTMLMKTKDRIGYPTMCMKTKEVIDQGWQAYPLNPCLAATAG